MSILSSEIEVRDTKQAYNLFYKKYDNDRDKEKRNIVLKKWNDIVLPEIKETIEKRDVQSFFSIVSSQFFPPAGEAKDIALSWMVDSSIFNDLSLSQASKIYHSFSFCQRENGDVFVSAIIKRWEKIAISEIKKANDFDSLKLILSYVPSATYELFFTKWCACSSSINQIKEIHLVACNKINPCSEIHKIIDKATNTILFNQMPKIKNINSIKECYQVAPKESASRIYAFEKWIELCNAPEEADEAYQRAPESRKEQAYNRVKYLINLKSA